MKIGKFYEDKNTGELFMASNFTSCTYYWINVKGENIEEDKWVAWEHMHTTTCKNKQKIQKFLDNLHYRVRGLCNKCNKTFVSDFKSYENERACGDEFCPICGKKLWY